MLSIIIPYYNKSKFFKKTINSINNSFLKTKIDKNLLEIIVVNDGSTENESLLLKSALNDCLVQYSIIEQQNSGVSSARNTGLRSSKNNYIYFLDADDEICDELFFFIKNMKRRKFGGDFEMNYFFPLAINRKVRIQPQSMIGSLIFDDESYLKMLDATTLHLSCIVFSRKIIGNIIFDEDVISGEDLLFIYNALINSNCVAFDTLKPIGVYKYDGKFHTVNNNGLSKVLLNTNYLPLQERLYKILNYKAYMENCFFDSKLIVDLSSIPLLIKVLCFFKSPRLYSLVQSLRFLISV